jgi:dinuclear metal center YbgI/SA1388 family protein
MKIKEITNYLESIAPLNLQEAYDNCGLLVGDDGAEVKGILIALDVTEAVVEEAIAMGCNLIISHHPLIFGGMKKITSKDAAGRIIIRAVQNNIHLYAAHTNMDNIATGVNGMIASKLGLLNCSVLKPAKDMLKTLVTYCPVAAAENLRHALFQTGAGYIGKYDSCSFNSEGTGTFRARDGANPYVGEIGKEHHEKEERIEIIYYAHLEVAILKALFEAHPYEEVAYNLFPISNTSPTIGAGIIGYLEEEIMPLQFLKSVKEIMKADGIRYTALPEKKIKKVAVCGGSGSFLLRDAIQAGADILITADFKYHQFFEAENRIVVADIGHYESEQFTKELFYEFLIKKNYTFAIHLSKENTNPINYL